MSSQCCVSCGIFLSSIIITAKIFIPGGGGGAGAHSSESTLNQRGMWI